MNRFQILINQLECVDQMMTAKIENERTVMNEQFYTQIVSAHQKVSLAEKQFYVKNACSHFTSERE